MQSSENEQSLVLCCKREKWDSVSVLLKNGASVDEQFGVNRVFVEKIMFVRQSMNLNPFPS